MKTKQLPINNVKHTQRVSNKQKLQTNTIAHCLLFIFHCSLFIALFSLSLVSCDTDYTSDDDYKNVEYGLRGTWECTNSGFWPEGQTATSEKGKLVFDLNTVTITGPIAHLQGFTRSTVLEAYTQEGSLYIKDRGVWQSPIAYIRWESGGSSPKDQMLTLEGDETLKRISQ